MGGGNLCIRLAFPVAEAEEFLIPMRGGQRVYKPLRLALTNSYFAFCTNYFCTVPYCAAFFSNLAR